MIKAYKQALNEYRHGDNPEWYWQGYHRRPAYLGAGDAFHRATDTVTNVIVWCFVIALILIPVYFVFAFTIGS